MRAVTVHEFGGPEVLQVEEIDKPTPKENEVLIEVHASGLNPVDIKSISKDSHFRSSMHLPVTPGMDLAGVVEMVGKGVNNIQAGDKVFGQAGVLRKGSGAFAEYAVTSEDSIALMPGNLNFIEAASIPLAAASAYEAIFTHMKLKSGQKILIHGGSGGIGSFAIQLAKHVGAHVTATASHEGIEFARHLGADHVLDYKTTSFDEKVRDYDAVLDTVGGDTYRKSFQVVKPGGIIVSMLAKPDEELMRQTGVRAVLEMTRVDRKVLSEIARLVEDGVLTVNISRTFPLEATRQAYEAKEKQHILGKIAIDIKH
jgi:alcohol dehydrogenase